MQGFRVICRPLCFLWLILVAALDQVGSIQVISQFTTTLLSNYPSTSTECRAKISYPVIGYACGKNLYFGLYLKRLESIICDCIWSNKFLVFANTVVYFKTSEDRNPDAIIKATHYQIKGGGPDPSFESSNAKFVFAGKKVTDGILNHVQVNNTHFIFAFVDASESETDVYKPKLKRYFEEFGSQRILEAPTTPAPKKWMIVTVLDLESLMFIKTAELELDTSLSNSWEDVKVSYVGTHSNHLFFHIQIDQNAQILVSTVQNSMRMRKVAEWKGDSFRLESPLSLFHGYILTHTKEGIVLSAQDDCDLGRLLTNDSPSSRYSLQDPLVPKQQLKLGRLKLVKTSLLMNGLGLVITVSQENNLMVYGSYYRSSLVQGGFAAQDFPSEELVMSKLIPVLQKDFKGQILDIEVSNTFFPVEDLDLRPVELTILLLNRTDDLMRLTAPLCPPNHLLEATPDGHYSHKCRLVTEPRYYSPGLQSNEVKQFDDQLSSLHNGDLLVDEGLAYTAGYLTAMAKFSLESSNIHADGARIICDTQNSTKEGQELPPTKRCFGSRPSRSSKCTLYTDCYNCSMDVGCLWNNTNHTCDLLSFGPDPKDTQELSHYNKTIYFTGSKALDLAAMKIHNTCPKRFDMKVENYQGGSYYNLSLIPGKSGEPILVRRGFAYSIDIGDKSDVFDYSVRIELFDGVWPKESGQSPVMIFRGAKISNSKYSYRDTAASSTLQVNLFEFLRKWRHTGNTNSVSGMYTAESLSISIIFPEDTIVNGTLRLHLVETDRWLTEFMVYAFVFIVLSFVVGVLCMLSCLGCARWFLIRTGRAVPPFLQRYIKPILRNYKFYLARSEE